MDKTKNPKLDLERKRGLFFQTGLIIVMTLVLLAFEWKAYNMIIKEFEGIPLTNIDEDDIPITRQEPPPPPPPPAPTSILEIVKNENPTQDEPAFDNELKEIKEIVPIIHVPFVETYPEDNTPFIVVEEEPYFPGGETERLRFLQNNLHYPDIAKRIGIQGTVFINFVVEKNGTLSNIKILRGIGGGCDEEAIRVTRNMPAWIPGKQRGQPVRVSLNMPIRFELK